MTDDRCVDDSCATPTVWKLHTRTVCCSLPGHFSGTYQMDLAACMWNLASIKETRIVRLHSKIYFCMYIHDQLFVPVLQQIASGKHYCISLTKAGNWYDGKVKYTNDQCDQCKSCNITINSLRQALLYLINKDSTNVEIGVMVKCNTQIINSLVPRLSLRAQHNYYLWPHIGKIRGRAWKILSREWCQG